jgi:diguanylate cyclase (GGDEF)-like protein
MPNSPTGRRGEGRRRLVGAALAGTILLLTAGAVAGSWRQSELVAEAARSGDRIDAYQDARYLAVLELSVLQAVVVAPDEEERHVLPAVTSGLAAALERLNRIDHAHASIQEVTGLHRRLQPSIARYLGLIDAGRRTDALEVLESELEPFSGDILRVLTEEETVHVAAYRKETTAARQESAVLRTGTLVLFVVGLVVLALVNRSGRAHRRLIERMAVQDALTGLPNRTAFSARAELVLAQAGADPDRQPTVLVLDLDGFKDVNDTLGHHHGDLLLVEVAERLRASLRAGDTVARLGGDEFAMLLQNTDARVGEEVAARICQALGSPFVLEDISVDIEASIGIATAVPGEEVTSLVRQADVAMYTAKEHRLGYARYEPNQTQDTAARLTVLGAMRRALDNDEIVLFYQPKMAVEDGDLLGVEALARWQHPTRGLLPPLEFIPVVENTSLVHRFTAHVLDKALAQVREWLDEGRRVPVAVNVSTRCLLDREFPETVARALMAAGVPGELLCIEITENTVMANPERAIDVLRRIRALGVRTAIDDFGTGYSSMAYLKILPVDELKVDRSFVRDLAVDSGNRTLVASAVDLGHNLGLAVVAEGVEDDPTMVALKQMGCDVAQGYHLGRPVAAADLGPLLAAARPAARS